MAKRAVAVAALAASLAVPASAAADDLGVRRAVCANDADFVALGKSTDAARRSFARYGYRRPRRLLALLSETRQLLASTRAGVEPVAPSTARGAEGKKLYLLSFTDMDRGLRTEITGVKRAARNRRYSSTIDAAFRLYDRSRRRSRAARSIFRELGVSDSASGCTG